MYTLYALHLACIIFAVNHNVCLILTSCTNSQIQIRMSYMSPLPKVYVLIKSLTKIDISVSKRCRSPPRWLSSMPLESCFLKTPWIVTLTWLRLDLPISFKYFIEVRFHSSIDPISYINASTGVSNLLLPDSTKFFLICTISYSPASVSVHSTLYKLANLYHTCTPQVTFISTSVWFYLHFLFFLPFLLLFSFVFFCFLCTILTPVSFHFPMQQKCTCTTQSYYVFLIINK